MYNQQFYPQRYSQNYPQQMQMQPSYVPLAVQNNQTAMQGKVVDSIEVVKAMDIPLDGSISYFPIIDGSAIVTKQLQTDGTSKMIIYEPINEKERIPKYVTFDDLKKELENLDFDDLRDEIKDIKKQLKTKKKDEQNDWDVKRLD